jgi:L-ascorbate metabolism protein UlaG (beta-lactamase superfamily)
MKITHLGHACLLVETSDARVLLDPGTMSSVDDVRDLAAILVTHQHGDHIDLAAVERLSRANPSATLVVDHDSARALPDLPPHRVVEPGARLTFGATTVDVLGGRHAAVYGDVPGCVNLAYLINGGALLHPGDSFFVPPQPVDVLAVAVDGPWLKVAEAVDYVRAVAPRVAIPIHEGETTDPAKYAGMLEAFSPSGVVRRLDRGAPTSL